MVVPGGGGLLQTLLLLGTFTCSLLLDKGSTNHRPSQNQAPSCVNGMLGGSVLFQINVSSSGNKTVDECDWVFQPQDSNKILTAANFREGKSQRPYPKDRFGQRLEAINETTLRIKDLELEDSGIYEARARLSNAEIEKYLFSLTVHKPLPEPQILPRVVADTPEGCNVTLQCPASGPGEFRVSWRRGSTIRSLEGGADWYQLSANGSVLRVFSKPNSPDSNFTCLVSSAVDQKKVSLDLLRICSFEGRKRTYLSFLSVLVLILAGAFGIWRWKKRRKSLSHDVLGEWSPPELQYAEIAKRRPPEGNENQDLGYCSPSLDQKSAMSTVYSELNLPL